LGIYFARKTINSAVFISLWPFISGVTTDKQKQKEHEQ